MHGNRTVIAGSPGSSSPGCHPGGARALLTRLRRLEEKHGPRFAPAPLLAELAAAGRTFHGP